MTEWDIETKKRFDLKPNKKPRFSFTGLQVMGDKTENVISQTSYINSLSLVPKNIPFAEFKSIHARLAWVANTTPDISYAVAFASQVTEEIFDESSQKFLNNVMKHLKGSPSTGLRFP